MAGAGATSATQAATRMCRRGIDRIIAVLSSRACPGLEPGPFQALVLVTVPGQGWDKSRAKPCQWISHLRRVRAQHGLVDVGAPAGAGGRREHAVLYLGRIGEQLCLPRHLVDV